MSERKVLNKYIPPNFDPAKIPKGLGGSKPKQHTVRLMAPFSMRCNTCGEFIYKGRKFNARKETVEGEFYLGIKIYRFYVRCPQCGAEITYKTDPQNADYVSEMGAKRNFEPWREEEKVTEAMKIKRQLEEENNPLKALENKAIDSKREIDISDALDEIRTVNARIEHVDTDTILLLNSISSKKKKNKVEEEAEEEEEEAVVCEADEEFISKTFNNNNNTNTNTNTNVHIKRVSEEDEIAKNLLKSTLTLTNSNITRNTNTNTSIKSSNSNQTTAVKRSFLGIKPKK